MNYIQLRCRNPKLCETRVSSMMNDMSIVASIVSTKAPASGTEAVAPTSISSDLWHGGQSKLCVGAATFKRSKQRTDT